MKIAKNLMALGVLALPTFLSAASTVQAIRVHVPFAFVIAGKEFKPGDYIVQADDNGIVSVLGGGKGVLALSVPANSGRSSAAPGLIFTKKDQREYLIGVQSDSTNGSRAIPVRAEALLK